MKTKIREFTSFDKLYIVKLMEEFGDYLVNIDTMKRQRRMPGYGEWFTDRMLELVSKNNGTVYVAENNKQIVGFIAGIVSEQTKEELLECIPTKAGRVIELFVKKPFREQCIGTKLMNKIEGYFRKKDCDLSRVEVFKPNIKAHIFYKKLGYCDRSIDLIKKL